MPRAGRSSVIRWPMVCTIRQPPEMVPSAIAVWAASTTHSGIGSLSPEACRWRWRTSRAAITLMVFWASLVPWPSDTAAELTSWLALNTVSLPDSSWRRNHRSSSHPETALGFGQLAS